MVSTPIMEVSLSIKASIIDIFIFRTWLISLLRCPSTCNNPTINNQQLIYRSCHNEKKKWKILLSSYSAGYDRIWPLFALCSQPLVSTKVVRAITPIYMYRSHLWRNRLGYRSNNKKLLNNISTDWTHSYESLVTNWPWLLSPYPQGKWLACQDTEKCVMGESDIFYQKFLKKKKLKNYWVV